MTFWLGGRGFSLVRNALLVSVQAIVCCTVLYCALNRITDTRDGPGFRSSEYIGNWQDGAGFAI